MDPKTLAVIVLAAGKGTRFGESYTKLLHPIFEKPLIYYPLQNLKNLNIEDLFVVISDPKVEEAIKEVIKCRFIYQEELTGTADAVKLVLPHIPAAAKNILVLNGDDATLYSKKTLDEFLDSHNHSNSKISIMTLKTDRQMQAGRIIRNKENHFSKILEHKEYLSSGVKSREINCGVYLIDLAFAKANLPQIQQSSNGEYYLTDLINIAREKQAGINLFILKDHSQWISINDKKDLKYATTIIKKRQLFFEPSEKIPKSKTVHFLGIAGSGTSACAKLAEAAGFKVTGCDINLSGEFCQILGSIHTQEGHSPDHLKNVDILAVTPAVLSLDPHNPELLAAEKNGVKVMTWQKLMGQYLTKNKIVIAVSGTHGKSTTTAMIGKIIEDAHLDPTILLGATASFWGGNFRIGQGKYFVVEADEFNDNFLSLSPDISIVTNIEYDHPEYFADFDSYKNSFRNFLSGTKSIIIANLSDQNTRDVLEDKSSELNYSPVIDYSKNLIDFPIEVTGKHNQLNASAAFNLALNLEIQPEKIKQSLQNFPGIGRRMELIGEINGAKIFSDFAHHPTAIKVATNQIKKEFPDKDITIIYQPHMFSRTKALFKEFVEVFQDLYVKKIAMLDIYPSREKDIGIIKTQDLIEAIGKQNVTYTTDVKEFFQDLKPNLSEKDIVIFMGAGDIDKKIKEIL